MGCRDQPAWVDAGAPCRISGVISYEETLDDTFSFDGPGGRITEVTKANLRMTVKRNPDGTATAQVSGNGEETVSQVFNAPGCTITSSTSQHWRINGGGSDPTAPKTVKAEVTIRAIPLT